MEISSEIIAAREVLGDRYNKASLADYVVPRLSKDQLDILVAEALWNRSLSISAAGRYDASRAAAMGNTDEDFDFEHAPGPRFGQNLPKPKRQRPRGQARAETASLVQRIVTRWLDQYSALGSVTGEKQLRNYTAAEFIAMAAAKRRLSETYGQQAKSDDQIALLMTNLRCETAGDLPVEVLYRVVKDYRPIAGAAPVEDADETRPAITIAEAASRAAGL